MEKKHKNQIVMVIFKPRDFLEFNKSNHVTRSIFKRQKTTNTRRGITFSSAHLRRQRRPSTSYFNCCNISEQLMLISIEQRMIFFFFLSIVPVLVFKILYSLWAFFFPFAFIFFLSLEFESRFFSPAFPHLTPTPFMGTVGV